ncbi:Methionine and alanine importer, small subunit [Alkalicoccus chagannorensis]
MTFLYIMAVLILSTWIGMAFVLFKTNLVDEEE